MIPNRQVALGACQRERTPGRHTFGIVSRKTSFSNRCLKFALDHLKHGHAHIPETFLFCFVNEHCIETVACNPFRCLVPALFLACAYRCALFCRNLEHQMRQTRDAVAYDIELGGHRGTRYIQALGHCRKRLRRRSQHQQKEYLRIAAFDAVVPRVYVEVFRKLGASSIIQARDPVAQPRTRLHLG